jgi:hypothetical protein
MVKPAKFFLPRTSYQPEFRRIDKDQPQRLVGHHTPVREYFRRFEKEDLLGEWLGEVD